MRAFGFTHNLCSNVKDTRARIHIHNHNQYGIGFHSAYSLTVGSHFLILFVSATKRKWEFNWEIKALAHAFYDYDVDDTELINLMCFSSAFIKEHMQRYQVGSHNNHRQSHAFKKKLNFVFTSFSEIWLAPKISNWLNFSCDEWLQRKDKFDFSHKFQITQRVGNIFEFSSLRANQRNKKNWHTKNGWTKIELKIEQFTEPRHVLQ